MARRHRPVDPTYQHPETSLKGQHERAVHILRNEPGDLTRKRAFMIRMGMTTAQIQTAERAAKRRPKTRKTDHE